MTSTSAFPPARSAFVSTAAEGPDRRDAVIEGALPDWLQGTLMRTAPALFSHGDWAAAHWFDGVGMLYRFSVESPSRVTWAQRLLECDAARYAMRGEMPLSSFASPNLRPFWKRAVQPVPDRTDNTNVNVLRVGDDWVAMTETPTQYAIDPDTLATRGRVRYDDRLGEGMATLAHPHYDSDRGRVVNLGTLLGPAAELVLFEHGPKERSRKEVARWKTSEFPYVHSFALTPTKAVLIDHPLRARTSSLLWSNKGYIDHFEWRAKSPTRLIVLDRSGGSTKVLETDPMFVFHTVNAFDDGDGLVMDLSAYPDPGIIAALRVDRLAAEGIGLNASVVRLRLDLAKGSVRREVLAEQGMELPNVSYRKVSGKRHRHAWGLRFGSERGELRTTLCAMDLDAGGTVTHADGDWVYGEPVFAGRPGATDEHDGVLLSVGCSPSQGRSRLGVFDPRTLERVATATVEVPLPLGFHGNFAR